LPLLLLPPLLTLLTLLCLARLFYPHYRCLWLFFCLNQNAWWSLLASDNPGVSLNEKRFTAITRIFLFSPIVSFSLVHHNCTSNYSPVV
jgi:hypothetical protein